MKECLEFIMETLACVHHFAAEEQVDIVQHFRQRQLSIMVCVAQFYQIPRLQLGVVRVLGVDIILQNATLGLS